MPRSILKRPKNCANSEQAVKAPRKQRRYPQNGRLGGPRSWFVDAGNLTQIHCPQLADSVQIGLMNYYWNKIVNVLTLWNSKSNTYWRHQLQRQELLFPSQQSLLKNSCHFTALQVHYNTDNKCSIFHILVTVHLNIILINNQLDAQILLYIFIPILYMFRTTLCSSLGESIVSIQHLVYVTYTEWHIPNIVLIQLILLMMRTRLLETCRELK
jgi:hypothetical protein